MYICSLLDIIIIYFDRLKSLKSDTRKGYTFGSQKIHHISVLSYIYLNAKLDTEVYMLSVSSPSQIYGADLFTAEGLR